MWSLLFLTFSCCALWHKTVFYAFVFLFCLQETHTTAHDEQTDSLASQKREARLRKFRELHFKRVCPTLDMIWMFLIKTKWLIFYLLKVLYCMFVHNTVSQPHSLQQIFVHSMITHSFCGFVESTERSPKTEPPGGCGGG